MLVPLQSQVSCLYELGAYVTQLFSFFFSIKKDRETKETSRQFWSRTMKSGMLIMLMN